jgi:hypothetical protein
MTNILQIMLTSVNAEIPTGDSRDKIKLFFNPSLQSNL